MCFSFGLNLCWSSGLGSGGGRRSGPCPAQRVLVSDLHHRPAEVDGGRGWTSPAAGGGHLGTLSGSVLPASGCFSNLRLSQTLSSELDALSAELSCQRSKVSGHSGVQQCLDDAFRVLSVIRASVAFREKQLSDLKQEDVRVSPRHRRYHGDQPTDY